MKRAPVVGLLLFVALMGGAAGVWMHSTARPTEISWLENSEAALEAARRQDKPVVLYLRTDWCTYCRQMEQTTLVDPGVAAEVADEFIWLRHNAEDGSAGTALRDRFGVDSYPAFILLDGEGNEIDRLRGYLPPERFPLDLRTVVTSPFSLGALKERQEADPESVEANFELGRKLLDRNEFGEAVRYLSLVVELDPANAAGFSDAGLFHLAAALTRVREHDAGLEALRALEKRFPDSPHLPDAVILKAEILLTEGRSGDAAAALQAFLVSHPTHAYAQRIREYLARQAPAGVPAKSH